MYLIFWTKNSIVIPFWQKMRIISKREFNFRPLNFFLPIRDLIHLAQFLLKNKNSDYFWYIIRLLLLISYNKAKCNNVLGLKTNNWI